ncbi:MAG TPA: site-specific integrase [Melioribacteraceae bacterium]|nr:site-specific integrase [Melioribacteraceae bacterium]
MFLTKKPNGTWYIVYADQNGKRTSLSTKTIFKSEADYQLKNFRKKYYEELMQDFTPITLKSFRWNFLKYSESVHTPKTTKSYRVTFNFLLNHFGDIQLSELTSKSIQDFLLSRISHSSIYAARKDHIHLSSMLNKAVLDGFLLKNPCNGIKRLRLPEKQPKFYTREDIEKLLSVMDNQDIIDITNFALNTGMRSQEICSLQWHQYDQAKRIITLDNSLYITKTKKIRSIPLNNTTLELLNRRMGRNKKGFIFSVNGGPTSSDKLSKIFKKYVYESKINNQLNFHSLRHTFASWLIQKGVPIAHISKLLGHADIKTTQIYAHLRPEDLRSAIELL